MQVDRVLETCLYAENLEQTATFYREVLGLQPFARVDQRHVFFRCGQSVLLLFNPNQTVRATGSVPTHGASGPGHVAFALAPQAIDAWRDRLADCGVTVEAEIAWPNGGSSLYFRDPAGNSVELTTPQTWGLPAESFDIVQVHRSVLNLLPIGACVVVAETGDIVMANDNVAAVLGVATAEVLTGRSVLEFVQPQQRAEVRDYLRDAAQRKTPTEFVHQRLKLASGRSIDLEVAAGSYNLDSRPVIQLAFRDITDRSLAETALRDSEALFRSLAETTEAAIFLFRGAQNLYVNAAACRITGYSYDELMAMPFWQTVHPDFRTMVRERGLARQQQQSIPGNYEVAILTKTGATRWVQYAGAVIDYQGEPAVLGTAIDITARREIEQALQESEARFRTVAQVSPASITVHVDDRLVYANPATFSQTGFSEEELKVIDFWSLLHADSVATMQQAYRHMSQGEAVSGLKLQVHTKNGTHKWLDINWSPFEQGGKTAWVITGYDITALVEAEQALRNYAHRLEALSQIDRLGLLAKSRQETAAAALDHIRALIPCDRASIVEVDAARQAHVVLAVSPQIGSAILPGRRFKLEHWAAVHNNLAHGIHRVADLDALPALTQLQAEIRSEGIRSYIAAPLTANDRLVGVLNLGSFQPNAFGDDVAPIVLEVGQRVALALYSAQLFSELERSHGRLEDMSRRLVQLQESERRHIARELHDEVGQTLTALGIHLGIAARADGEERPARLAEARRLVDDLAGRVRRMSLDLLPPMLDDLGLLPTLLWYFDWVAQQYQLLVVFEHQGIERRFDPDIETTMYRVVQEALTNVARHAQTQEAAVRLWADSSTISAQIEDRGQGFDLDLALSRMDNSGLSGMRERVRLLGGQLVIEAQPGNGACITALLPLKKTRRS